MDWSGIATAYLDRERARLGLPTREQEAAARQARELAARTGESNLETAGLGRQKLGAEIASLPAAAEQHRQLVAAQIAATNALAGQRETDKPQPQGTLRPLVNADGEVTGFYNEKTGEIKTNVPSGLRTKAAPKMGAGGAPVGSPVQITDASGKPGLFFPPKQAGVVGLPPGSSFATDTRTARKEAVAATAPLATVETMANQVEGALKRYEDTGWQHPIDKSVAQLAYKSQLEALAVPWGRLLGDTRISDQDRQSYAQSVGVPGVFQKEMAPDEARRRLLNLRQVIAQVRQKYGPVLEGSSGMLDAVGGGANLLGSSPAPAAPAAAPAPARPPGVPPEAQWDAATRHWRL